MRSISINKKTISKYKKVNVLNVPLTCCSFTDILEEMKNVIHNGLIGNYISITNTESIYHATRIPSHFNYITNANISCCDGVGVVIAGRMMGHKIPRLHGPDLMLRCCEYGVDKKWRHFFYGGKEGVPELLSSQLTDKYPGLITAGVYSPPFRELTPDEDKKIIDLIDRAKPDILWVGLGLLKQERWVAKHLGKIKVPWMIGVGAAFDFHSGTIKRAPKILRKIGLEGIYRTALEPRLLKRLLYDLSIFLLMIIDALRQKRANKPNAIL